MKRFGVRARVMLVLGLAIALVASSPDASADFFLGTPTNLGTPVNSAYQDGGVSLSADGLTLYLDSNRHTGGTDDDLWFSVRATSSDPWGPPTNLGSTVNSDEVDGRPNISRDGLALYFSSRRAGGYGSDDLWVTTRSSLSDPWGVPENLGSIVNGAAKDDDPSISSDGLSLYFNSNRPDGSGGWDLWVTHRTSPQTAWDPPVNLGSVVNTSSNEMHPNISSDGLSLFFQSSRPGGYGDQDLYIAHRESVTAAWTQPRNLGPMVNGLLTEAGPAVSADGTWLYFESSRASGYGSLDLWQAPLIATVDLDRSGIVDFVDFAMLAAYWQTSERSVDMAPPIGNGTIDLRDITVLADHWLQKTQETVDIQWLGHASVRVWSNREVIYIDPRNLSESPHDATLVLVTHSHGDHYSASDINKVWGTHTQLLAPADVVQSFGAGQVIVPGQTIQTEYARITGVPAYNLVASNHPKSRNWLGFVIELGGRRIYVAGDTDLTEEMKALTDIDVAFLPAGGTYAMDAEEAAEATQYIQPALAIPYHWGDIVGTLADAERFVALAACNAKVMTIGETIGSERWNEDFSIVAHWKLDETAGQVAADSAGTNNATLYGNPQWRPDAGVVDGAIELDGVDDYLATDFVVNPGQGPFSVFLWIKGGAAGQVALSQIGGADWLLAAPADGALMTCLVPPAGRTTPPPLVSQVAITDGQWHHIGLTWDGTSRILYADGAEVAKDAQAAPVKSDNGLHIGTGADLTAGTFWDGLVDNIRVHSRPVAP